MPVRACSRALLDRSRGEQAETFSGNPWRVRARRGKTAPASVMANVSLACLLLLLVGPSDPPRVHHGGEWVDPRAVATGIELRMGTAAQGWDITVADGDPQGSVAVRLHSPQGDAFEREVVLEGETLEERSRELVSAVVLMLELHGVSTEPDARAEPDGMPAPDAAAPTRGFVTAMGRLAVGSPPALELGAELAGGAWVVREILLPWVEVGWARSQAGELAVDGVRFGTGLGAGAPLLAGQLWMGGLVATRATWARARDAGRASAWMTSTFVGGLLAGRPRAVPLVLMARIGGDFGGPPLRFVGNADALRWGSVRFSASVGIGVVLGRHGR